MRRSIAFILGAALSCAMSVAPVLADTPAPPPPSNSTTNMDHTIDCLGLLFSDPAKHAQECGGPNFTPPAPPSSGGSGACTKVVQIDPMTIPDLQIKSDADLMVAEIECGKP